MEGSVAPRTQALVSSPSLPCARASSIIRSCAFSCSVIYATHRIDESNPDLVIIPVSGFVCTVGVVALRVRQLFGKRPYRWVRMLEKRSARRTTAADRSRGRAYQWGRRLAHRTIGTATYASLDSCTAAFTGVFRHLAQLEQTAVLVIAEPPFAASVLEENPRAKGIEAKLQDRVRAAAEEHRFAWIDFARSFAGREQYLYAADGVHTSAMGHQVKAEAVALALKPLLAVS